MLEDLRNRIEHLGLRDVTDLKGYVPLRPGLLELYRSSHVLLHVSWTEGLPQVLIEACASGLPIVATDVGGVGALGSAAILVPPGDAAAAAQAATTIVEDSELRQALIDAGNRYAAAHVLDAEVSRVAAFISAA
jgi:phenylacetate-CoA ligase